MNKLKGAEESIDIYYNNLAPEFVVSVINNLDESKTKHFRSSKLKKAIESACDHLLTESEK